MRTSNGRRYSSSRRSSTLARRSGSASKGAYTVTGQASPWIKVPHSEAYYGARACGQ
ncbi:immune inhibitor A domain-containing protein, partial [Streptosporangium sp. NPDC048865]|uniref:immune inhibitor A domain-containing protein n=1 Tax=Streptosporangium sp. NPDC048865 TaxID=3155766 RepID=UPI003448F91E